MKAVAKLQAVTRLVELRNPPANAVTGILNGTRGVSAQMALRIGKAFATGPHYWMTLQANYEEKLALRALGDKIDGISQLVPSKVA